MATFTDFRVEQRGADGLPKRIAALEDMIEGAFTEIGPLPAVLSRKVTDSCRQALTLTSHDVRAGIESAHHIALVVDDLLPMTLRAMSIAGRSESNERECANQLLTIFTSVENHIENLRHSNSQELDIQARYLQDLLGLEQKDSAA